MSKNAKELAFFAQLATIVGRRIEIVTGRNGYTIGKEKHAQMMKEDGMYLILERPPVDDTKITFDKAFILPAAVTEGQFVTKDPARIKYSYTLPGDILRFRFYQQMHQIYNFENPTMLIKCLDFRATRRTLKILKRDQDILNKYQGKYLILCVSSTGRLIDIIERESASIVIPEGHVSKDIPIDLSQAGIDRLWAIQKEILKETVPETVPAKITCNDCQSKGGGDCATCTPPVFGEKPSCANCEFKKDCNWDNCKKQKPNCFRHEDITPNLNANSICLSCQFLKECNTREKPPEPVTNTNYQQIDTYLQKGTPLTISFPEGNTILTLNCLVIEQIRTKKPQEVPK